MKIVIGSDHGGFKLKEEINEYLSSKEHDVDDIGAFSEVSCDYPDLAAQLAEKVLKKGDFGILVCGTGIGMCITANKFKGIRAALCYDEYTAKMAREHNDANVLCLGGRTTKSEEAKKIVNAFLNTKKSEEERHKKRVAKISLIEKQNFKK